MNILRGLAPHSELAHAQAVRIELAAWLLALIPTLACAPALEQPVQTSPSEAPDPEHTPAPEPEPEPEPEPTGPIHAPMTASPEAHPVLWGQRYTEPMIRSRLDAYDPATQRAWIHRGAPHHSGPTAVMLEVNLNMGQATTLLTGKPELFDSRANLVALADLAAQGHALRGVLLSPDGSWMSYDHGHVVDRRGREQASPFGPAEHVFNPVFGDDSEHFAYLASSSSERWYDPPEDWATLAPLVVERAGERREVTDIGPVWDIAWSPTLGEFFVITNSGREWQQGMCVHRLSADGSEHEQLVCVEQQTRSASVWKRFAPAARLVLIGSGIEQGRRFTWVDLERGEILDELELKYGSQSLCLFDDGVALVRTAPPLNELEQLGVEPGVTALGPGRRSARVLAGNFSSSCERAADGSTLLLRHEPTCFENPGSSECVPLRSNRSMPREKGSKTYQGSISLVRLDVAALLREAGDR